MGVGRRTPSAALQGDMGWSNSEHRQWICISRQWCRLANMSHNRINSAIFHWAQQYATRNKKTVYAKVMSFFCELDMEYMNDTQNVPLFDSIKETLNNTLSAYHEKIWSDKIMRESALRGPGRNKLRTYRGFKNKIFVEPYLKVRMQRPYRAALAKFRSGVAPLKIETGRYSNTPECERLCTLCNENCIENEVHVVTQCQLYQDIREVLYAKASAICNNFHLLSDIEKLNFILSDTEMTVDAGKACHGILKRRQIFLYKM